MIMKNKKTIVILVCVISIFSIVVCFAGLYLNSGIGKYEFKSITGENIEIYGKGLYKNDSISVVAQGKATDVVTLVFAIPMLILSLIFSLKGSFRGRLLLSGALGYFLYTYMSYVFLWMYNSFFIVYIIIMSSSFFAFILSLMSFDIRNIAFMFNEKLPVRFLGGFQFFVAFIISMLWLGKIIPSILNGITPNGLEHYTTLVIQAMDLGFVVPASIISGIQLIKKRPFGYLLSSVIIIKGATLLLSITAMVINMMISGVEINMIEAGAFLLLDILVIFCLILLLKNTKEIKNYTY